MVSLQAGCPAKPACRVVTKNATPFFCSANLVEELVRWCSKMSDLCGVASIRNVVVQGKGQPPQFSFNGSEGRGCMFIVDRLEGINFVE